MGIKESLQQLVSSRTETAERHAIEGLRTRYYKTSKDKALRAVEELLRASNWTITRSENDRGEIVAKHTKGKKMLLVATVITVKPFRTAIDFSCSVDTVLPSDFGYSRKVILSIYQEIDKELTYVGSGLGEELM